MERPTIVNEALRDDREYEGVKVKSLPIEEFRGKFGGVEFRRVWAMGMLSGTVPDEESSRRLKRLEEAVVRYIPFSDAANFVDAAVVVDKEGEPILDFRVFASHVMGVFYVAGKPRSGGARKNIQLIYEDLAKNPYIRNSSDRR